MKVKSMGEVNQANLGARIKELEGLLAFERGVVAQLRDELAQANLDRARAMARALSAEKAVADAHEAIREYNQDVRKL